MLQTGHDLLVAHVGVRIDLDVQILRHQRGDDFEIGHRPVTAHGLNRSPAVLGEVLGRK